MTPYLARRLVAVSERLDGINFVAFDKEDYEREGKAATVHMWLREVIEECRFLGLDATLISATLLLEEVARLPCDDVFDRVNMLREVFHRETVQIRLFFIPATKQSYLLESSPCGSLVADKFPKANYQISEAAKCFATDRYTACVFHLMRALEHGLRAVSSGLGMADPIGVERNWGNMLKAIKDKLGSNNSSRRRKWKVEKEFYEKAYAFLEGVRGPLRNATMHVEADYDEQGALDIFNATSTFMRHISTRLTE